MDLKNLIKIPLSIRPLSSARNNYIITYHNISTPEDPSHSPLYSTNPERFKAQIKFFAKYFDLVSLKDIVSARDSKRPRLALSFDDGFISVKKTAWPILKEMGAPFTVFLNRTAVETGVLDYGAGFPELRKTKFANSSFMTLEDIREMLREGVDFGSHGASHRILSDCTDEELQSEIADNAEFLRTNLQIEIPFFAIPFGKKKQFNSKVIAAALAAGHKYLLSSNPSHFVASEDVVKPRISLLDENEKQISFLLNRSLFKAIDL